jgi:hypothetical protein
LKEVAVACLKVLPRNLSRSKARKSQSLQLVSQPKFKLFTTEFKSQRAPTKLTSGHLLLIFQSAFDFPRICHKESKA